jgi:hypothetical protein
MAVKGWNGAHRVDLGLDRQHSQAHSLTTDVRCLMRDPQGALKHPASASWSTAPRPGVGARPSLESSMIKQRITRRLVRTSKPPTDLRTPSGRPLPY